VGPSYGCRGGRRREPEMAPHSKVRPSYLHGHQPDSCQGCRQYSKGQTAATGVACGDPSATKIASSKS
jgi:hypothetical protein